MAKKKQGMIRVLANNLFMLRYVAKFTPGLIVWSQLMAVFGGLIGTLDTVYIAKFVLDGLQDNTPFVEMLPFLLAVVAGNIILAFLNGFYTGSYFPRKKEYLYGKMHEELFEKARGMELSCYDNPKFYNEFVWAMSQADEKALDVLDSFGRMLTAFTLVSTTVAIVAGIDYVGVIVVAVSLILEGIVQIRMNKLEYGLSVEQNPLQRKRDYTSRILYQPEYAKEVRLSPVKKVLIANFHESNEDLMGIIRHYGVKQAVYSLLANAVLYQVLLYGFYIGYLLYGTLARNLYTYGDFYALFMGAVKLSDNWDQLVLRFSRLQKDSLYIEKFRHFLEYEPKMQDKEDALPLPDGLQTISLEHVSFAYEGMSKPVLKDINLTIHPNEKIAVVGYNGAGKTTLMKLLMRLYDVSDGTIRLGDRDIREYKLKDFRNYFGVVFQDYQLLAATIGENVMMDCTKGEDEDLILSALEKSGFGEKLDSLSLGTKTVVSREFDKNGVNLSGGEGQKVAIARVFPRDCKMVILDEPSSALDPISEYNVNQSMLAAAQDKTVVFISHRLSTTRIADRIIMLEDGRIIEQGSHEELMKLGGKYAQMFTVQAKKYKEQAD